MTATTESLEVAATIMNIKSLGVAATIMNIESLGVAATMDKAGGKNSCFSPILQGSAGITWTTEYQCMIIGSYGNQFSSQIKGRVIPKESATESIESS